MASLVERLRDFGSVPRATPAELLREAADRLEEAVVLLVDICDMADCLCVTCGAMAGDDHEPNCEVGKWLESIR